VNPAIGENFFHARQNSPLGHQTSAACRDSHELAALLEIGDGALHRVVMAAQRVYFDPPQLGGGRYR
jgi:hypothetical protein